MVRCEILDDPAHVALVTIDRPEAANSLDPATLTALAGAWRRLAADDAVRCVVLTGAGDRVFCAGMDLKTTIPAAQKLARGERVSDEEFEGLRSVVDATLVGLDLGKPLVAAINGHARAGGFDLMLASELRYAVPEATFGLEEVELGLFPTGHATVLLPRQIGWVFANELLLTADPVGAGRAREMGLINEIVDRDALLDRVLERAGRIAANAPLAVTATRRALRELWSEPLEVAYRRQEELGRPIRGSEDAREGVRAKLERRRPTFRGR